jgi:hypothetical protein
MPAKLLLRTRVIYSEVSLAELVLWQLPQPLAGSSPRYKYRLAYVVEERCVIRYDSEATKGDHRHYGGREFKYVFGTVEKLIADFQNDIARWDRENRSA